MASYLFILLGLVLYATIGVVYGGYLSTQLYSGSSSDKGPKNTWPWSVKDVCMTRGIFWCVFLTWDLLHIPGRQIAKIGVYLGEKQTARQTALLARQQALRVEQEKLRVQLSKIEKDQIEEESLREAEACCQAEKR